MEKVFYQLPNFEKMNFQIKYYESTRDAIIEGCDQHIHSECEIYVNLSGDVSFMVEDTIYPISKGSVIITRPYEYHHCIYNSGAAHGHYWILFSSSGNEHLLDLFFKRKIGTGNLILFDESDREQLLELCESMCCDTNESHVSKMADFFNLISLLERGKNPILNNNGSKRELKNVLNYINTNYINSITIKEIAMTNNMSVNTLERKFLKALKMTPSAYIKQKRLANAVRLLSEGESVTNACINSGFSDCSAFITLFKKQYGMTPLKYKQKIEGLG